MQLWLLIIKYAHRISINQIRCVQSVADPSDDVLDCWFVHNNLLHHISDNPGPVASLPSVLDQWNRTPLPCVSHLPYWHHLKLNDPHSQLAHQPFLD
jgi:hypothetical protein